MKYSFLEFDEQALLKEIIGKEVYTVSAIAGAKYQHSKDTAIFKQLIEIINLQNETLKKASEQYYEESPFSVYPNRKPTGLALYAKDTLAAVENKLKELDGK
jgi:hypothetical protein